VSKFRYLGDRLFLITCSLYALNRWVINPHVHSPFLRYHFNDLLLIPCALPPLLLVQRWLGLRSHDTAPTASEITFHVIVWSILFELIGPHIMSRATGDPWDAVAYAAGGLLAGLWWHRRAWWPRGSPNEF
jgi:hypothetical protein